jgi:hypothetical protein
MEVVAWFSLVVTVLFAIVWVVELVRDELQSERAREQQHHATR